MSYQVLARKWRPKVFREMVGQEHVLKALINALDHNRLHHAYLFTGTRGVGKTTIARILAKCLNCEAGVSSEPCGVCSACVEIAEGRFIDLIEVDAASRTKVEDTRELLENVQYAPTRGRYKVYLIDEVHMLSTHSFNALLKTLEEPPPHVKFLLATTDPQKLPATILSRCLQFHLKNMTPERIVQHLQHVLAQEMVNFEEPALWLLGRSADGSMRDALSLTDQAIAFGSGKVVEADVRAMLGSIDRGAVYALLDALAALDGAALLAAVAAIAEHATDFGAVLEELLGALHRIAVAQAVPDALDNSQGDRERMREYAAKFAGEDVQLFYQMALHGRRDLPLASDPRAGLEMTLLRMLAFKPQGVPQPPGEKLKKSEAVAAAPMPHVAKPVAGSSSVTAVTATAPSAVTTPTTLTTAATLTTPAAVPTSSGNASSPMTAASSRLHSVANAEQSAEIAPPPSPVVSAKPTLSVVPNTPPLSTAAPLTLASFDNATWSTRFNEFGIGGIIGTIASHCCLLERKGEQLHFVLDEKHASFFDSAHTQRITDQLSRVFETPVRVHIVVGTPHVETPAAYRERIRLERLAQARVLIEGDANVKLLQDVFGAMLDVDSIKPLD
ncbi:MAG: DNA polymerase III subunit gamma/tau [Spongiibacteraceae bacterium]